MLPEKHKDLLGDLVGGLGGRTRVDTDPYDCKSETPLLLLSRRWVGEEPGWVDGRTGDIPFRDQVTNLGTDIVPSSIERDVVDFTDRLDKDMAVSADGLGEGCRETRWCRDDCR
jgi:hypothetical protein